MKKHIKYIIFMVVMLAAIPFHLRAEVTETDVTGLDYVVYTNSATAKAGEEITLSVCMKNINAIATWQADLTLPEGVTIATDEYGDPKVVISTARTSTLRHAVSTSTLTNGGIRILCSSATNKTFSGTDGEVITITIKLSDELDAGKYAIILSNEVMSEANGTGHKVSSVTSVLEIEDDQDAINCDVNKDGKVDMADITYIVNYLLKRK